ncbi:MAG TPA: cation:proton antiporter [Chlorobaculum sp.]|nr:cation:proton antiporter [Chlorobaculum sp.]
MEHFAQIILLLAVSISVVVAFQRLHIPTSLGYLLVGVLLGPYTIGPVVYVPEFNVLAEFGVVFLLFTIGLDFSIPQIYALRHQLLGIGTSLVVLTILVVAVILWLIGVPLPVAFVFGAVFAQSSTTIIASLLAEQGEANSQHGRFGVAMSVFQDVTAVPLLVIIPVLGVSVSPDVLVASLALAFVKAVVAFVLVFLVGRWLLRPMFRLISKHRSSEIFTLVVLLVALLASWTTNSQGLSLAFGGFLAGMMIGETEFRHQVESSIRPFRDVLLGMFFIGIGMRFDPAAIPPIWYWSVLGGLLIMLSKTLIAVALVHRLHMNPLNSWRSGLMLGVGGEFGLALVAVALDSRVFGMQMGQIAISSVLLSMIGGAVLIRFNGPIASWFVKTPEGEKSALIELPVIGEQQVVIGGYGRVGHTIAVLLRESGVPFTAFDTDPKRVAQGRADAFPVAYGDISDPGLLAAIQVERASLVVISVDNPETALKTTSYLSRTYPQVPVVARARDLEMSGKLLDAGAIKAYPETIEASLRLAEIALRILNISSDEIDEAIQGIRDRRYKPVMDEDHER